MRRYTFKKRKKTLPVFLVLVILITLSIPAFAQTIRQLQKQVTQSELTIEDYQYRADEIQKTIDQINNQIANSRAKVNTLTIQKQEKTAQIEELNNNLNASKENYNTLKDQKDQQTKLLSERQKLKNSQGTEAYYQAFFSGAKPEVGQNEEQLVSDVIATNQQEINNTKNQVSNVQVIIADLEDKQVELKAQVEQINQDIENENVLISQQELLLEENQAVLDETQSKITDEEAAMAEANQKIQEIAKAAETKALEQERATVQTKLQKVQLMYDEVLKIAQEIGTTGHDVPDSEILTLAQNTKNNADHIQAVLEQIQASADSVNTAENTVDAVKISKEIDKQLLTALDNTAQAKNDYYSFTQIDVNARAEVIREAQEQARIAQEEAEAAARKAQEEAEQAASNPWHSQYLSSTGWRWPLNDIYDITSYFGNREHPIFGSSSNHEGIDIAASSGTPIHACDGGEVILAGQNGGYGNCIVIQQNSGHQVYYGHLSEIGVTEGQVVNKGDTIGLVGSTGWSTGPHLHLGVLVGGSFVDPFTFFPEVS